MAITNQNKQTIKDFALDEDLDNVDLDALEQEEQNTPEDQEDEQDKQEDQEDVQPEKKQADIDYKEKFANSSREAQILMEQNKALEKQLEEITAPKEVTQEDLEKEYPDWEDLTDTEKKLAKKNLELQREFSDLKKHSSEYVNERIHRQKIATFLENNEALGDQGVPAIKGREAEFTEFAQKNSRKGLEPEVLAKIFLYENPSSEQKHKGSLFHTGSGNGNQQKAKSNQPEKITAEEAKRIRLTNQRKYQQLVRAGKLDHLKTD